jgi:hypothetical protein
VGVARSAVLKRLPNQGIIGFFTIILFIHIGFLRLNFTMTSPALQGKGELQQVVQEIEAQHGPQVLLVIALVPEPTLEAARHACQVRWGNESGKQFLGLHISPDS